MFNLLNRPSNISYNDVRHNFKTLLKTRTDCFHGDLSTSFFVHPCTRGFESAAPVHIAINKYIGS